MDSTEIIRFWFEDIKPAQWWKKDPTFDDSLGQRFSSTLTKARGCELFHWRKTPLGRLAEVIVLDQFSRNIYRDQAKAFSHDALALALAQEAIACGDDQKIPVGQRAFLYMPFMHSESKSIHIESMRLFESDPALKGNLNAAISHKKIIDRFGRYPHRNKILGRPSTEEEIAFLKEPGSSF